MEENKDEYPKLSLDQLYGHMDQFSFLDEYREKTEKLKEILGPDWGWDKGITYDSGFADLLLNHKGLNARGNIPALNMNYDAFLGDDSQLRFDGTYDPLGLNYDGVLREAGDFGLNASMDLLGGTLGVDMQSDQTRLNFNGNYDPLGLHYDGTLGEGGDYGLNASVPLLGGSLAFETNRQGDDKQYRLTYRLGNMPQEPTTESLTAPEAIDIIRDLYSRRKH